MKIIKASKPLVFVPTLSACVLLVAGCHSTKSHSGGEYYGSPSGTGAPVISDSSGTMQSSRTTSQGAQITSGTAQDQVAIPLYEEKVIVGTRNVESGGVRLRKEVITETVNQPVQVRRETLVVDREAATGDKAAAAAPEAGKQAQSGSSGSLGTPFEKGEMVITLHSEEPVVETRVVPTGKIVVQTRTSTEQQTVQRQVRREKIDVDKMGDSQNVIISDNVTGQKNEAVGATPATSGQTQGQGAKQQSEIQDTTTTPRTPVTTEEGQPFPRPQPDGRETFPSLNKNPQK
jgi:stress response protein YsnF